MTIRILIVDDHCIVAEGLRSLIQAQADMEVIACVQDGREAVRWSMETRPDVVLMDNAMPQLNGTGATQIICERLPETRVIMLSMYSDPIHFCRALQAGATGYVLASGMCCRCSLKDVASPTLPARFRFHPRLWKPIAPA